MLTRRQVASIERFATWWLQDREDNADLCRHCDSDDGQCYCGTFRHNWLVDLESADARASLTECAISAIDERYTDTWSTLSALDRCEAISVAVQTVRRLQSEP